MEVRPYRPGDAPALARLQPRARRLPQQIVEGAQVWVAAVGQAIVGYASILPVPGLPGVVDLDGFVGRAQRRQGIGSALLARVQEQATGAKIEQLSHSVPSLHTAAAHFLLAHNFYLEHEEWWLERVVAAPLPAPHLPDGCEIQTFTRPEANRLFRAVYEQSFGGTPWYQPYSSAEVAAALARASDLLFLICQGQPAGFAWMRREQDGIGLIEPFGIAAPFQGRGYGRLLLLSALHRLGQQGAHQIQLGLWRRNEAALKLYQSAGFRHTSTLYYLALDL